MRPSSLMRCDAAVNKVSVNKVSGTGVTIGVGENLRRSGGGGGGGGEVRAMVVIH